MNLAAKALVARDPLISANAVRFLLMAGVKGSTFLAGFRKRQDGEVMPLWQSNPSSLAARKAVMHNGAGSFVSDAARGKIKLRYRTYRYDYNEGTILRGPNGYSTVTELLVANQRFPETMIAAMPGRRLSDLISHKEAPTFFASRYTTIAQAEMTHFPGSDALAMILDIKWYRLSQVLPRLG